MLKQIASKLPDSLQFTLRRMIYRAQIARGTFTSPEIEYERLQDWIAPDDWVVDMGANIGHFTACMSDLVGPGGRVIAFEPITTTFAMLSLTVNQLRYQNVTLINMAASDGSSTVNMGVPDTETGLPNYYMAKISESGGREILAIKLDDIGTSGRIAVIKIDVEGHELKAVKGAVKCIQRDHPILIVETRDDAVIDFVKSLGYTASREGNSPNVVFLPEIQQQ